VGSVPSKPAAPERVRAGIIVNMSSVAGRFGYRDRSPYWTAKWTSLDFGADAADR
jgi:NAD(P)-dependent dehydrogenase (short-subunit alcohol dehydrogenase family)